MRTAADKENFESLLSEARGAEPARQLGHIMVDIETMSQGSYAVILSLGAVEFDISTGQTGRTFYRNIDLQSCLDAGLKVEGDTVYWWLSKGEEARQALLGDRVPLRDALLDFSGFVSDCGSESVQVWGNSARFDLGKLDDAYRATQLKYLWRYSNERDVRTLVAFAPHIKKEEVRQGTYHHALDDCFHQISYCSKIWQSLSK